MKEKNKYKKIRAPDQFESVKKFVSTQKGIINCIRRYGLVIKGTLQPWKLLKKGSNNQKMNEWINWWMNKWQEASDGSSVTVVKEKDLQWKREKLRESDCLFLECIQWILNIKKKESR